MLLGVVAYSLWSPGHRVRDGRHDLGRNGIWIGHGWIGGDSWFERYKKDPAPFRTEGVIEAMLSDLRGKGFVDIFPHLCPCTPGGQLPDYDSKQIALMTGSATNQRILPWVGGVFEEHCFPEDPRWRNGFVAAVGDLLQEHPDLDGIHLNIEPMPDGTPAFLTLLEELAETMGPKTLSVAAYPPPTRWHPHPDVHWGEDYFQAVAARVDQVVPMMYDTGLRLRKPYRQLMAHWTRQVLAWSGDTPVLLGIPAYADEGVGYHDPWVENIENALLGIHAGLAQGPPENYSGISLYSLWEMDGGEWQVLREGFFKD